MSIIPLLSGAWLQVFYYHATGYAAYQEWYWVSQLVIIVLTLSLILGMLYKLIQAIPYKNILAWALAAYVRHLHGKFILEACTSDDALSLLGGGCSLHRHRTAARRKHTDPAVSSGSPVEATPVISSTTVPLSIWTV